MGCGYDAYRSSTARTADEGDVGMSRCRNIGQKIWEKHDGKISERGPDEHHLRLKIH
jgi:hypothetical protein